MENLVALEQSAHQHIKIDTQKAQSHAENINMVPVSEFFAKTIGC